MCAVVSTKTIGLLKKNNIILSLSLSVVYACRRIPVCPCVPVCSRVEANGQHWLSSSTSLHLISLKQSLSLNLELSVSASMAAWEGPRYQPLSAPPGLELYRHATAELSFITWVLELRSSFLYTKSSLQSPHLPFLPPNSSNVITK